MKQPGLRAEAFIKDRLFKFTTDLLQQARTATRILLDLFTEHCTLKRDMFNLRLGEEASYHFSLGGKETDEYILCE